MRDKPLVFCENAIIVGKRGCGERAQKIMRKFCLGNIMQVLKKEECECLDG